jgi:DNA-binding response OmpR family regulator
VARIMVVDDDSQVRDMLTLMLEAEGHEVIVADDGEIGVDRYREDPTDIVITDIIMPEKSGTEAILELRKEFPDLKVIAMSGGGRTGPYGHLMLAQRFGADRVFAKPLKRRELLNAISELLEEA